MNKAQYCILILLALLPIQSTLNANEAETYQQARTWFDQALSVDAKALDNATHQFEKLLGDDPDNPVYRSYLGACKTLQGRDALMPWNKMRHTEQGLDEIDKALGSLNETHDRKLLLGTSLRLQTMLIAAITFIDLPDKVFHRHSKGKRLLRKLMAHPLYASSSELFKQSTQKTAALISRRTK